MTKERQEYLWSKLEKLQRSVYYNHVERPPIEDLVKTVNGNKDRLITIMATMLAKQNDRIGSLDLLTDEASRKIRDDKIDEILLNL